MTKQKWIRRAKLRKWNVFFMAKLCQYHKVKNTPSADDKLQKLKHLDFNIQRDDFVAKKVVVQSIKPESTISPLADYVVLFWCSVLASNRRDL